MRKIKLTQCKYALVDNEDYDALNKFKWYAKKGVNTFYAVRSPYKNGKQTTLKMHRLLINAPRGLEVDHKDGDGLNNQRSNIRLATRSQNRMNRPKQSRNTSGFKGVSWDKTHNIWRAYITLDSVQKTLGYFKNRQEAYQVYCKASVEYHKEFAHI
jgi:hypothetical protein